MPAMKDLPRGKTLDLFADEMAADDPRPPAAGERRAMEARGDVASAWHATAAAIRGWMDERDVVLREAVVLVPFVQLIDPSLGFQNGVSQDGTGTTTNVRTMWQRCPHLGCKPNFCDLNYWFECPCHGSRYDRLGTKVEELGPAPRSLDRFPHSVENGELIVDTSRVILGPLPIALGQPGLIPAKSPTGCI